MSDSFLTFTSHSHNTTQRHPVEVILGRFDGLVFGWQRMVGFEHRFRDRIILGDAHVCAQIA